MGLFMKNILFTKVPASSSDFEDEFLSHRSAASGGYSRLFRGREGEHVLFPVHACEDQVMGVRFHMLLTAETDLTTGSIIPANFVCSEEHRHDP
jgi:hypothetical protein